MVLECKRRRLWNAMLRVDEKEVIRLLRIADVVYRLCDSNPDRDDFSNRHISSIISFSLFRSSPYTMPVALVAGNLVDVHADFVKLIRKRLELGKVDVDNVAVNEHLPCVTAEILSAELLHFFLNQLLFLRCHPDDELFRSGSVLQIFSTPCDVMAVAFETGLGSAQQAQI